MSEKLNPTGGEPLKSGSVNSIEWQVCMGPCSIVGYARLPDGHPWIGADLQMGDVDVEVHGGITYQRGNVIGFDCNHLGDGQHPQSPGYRRSIECGAPLMTGRIWSEPEAEAEVIRLAEQASEALEEDNA